MTATNKSLTIPKKKPATKKERVKKDPKVRKKPPHKYKEKEKLGADQPLANRRREAIIQYMVANPEAQGIEVADQFNSHPTYISKMLRYPLVTARLKYLRQHANEKMQEKGAWSTEQLILKLQNKIMTTNSDMVFVRGCKILGRWAGMDKQTISHTFENMQQIQLTLQAKAAEVPVPEKTDEILTNTSDNV